MIKETTASGATLDEAIANARMLLGAPADADVHTEILELPKKKVFGLFGGGLAIVKATWDVPDEKGSKSSDKKYGKIEKPKKAVQPKAEAKPEAKAKKEEPEKPAKPKPEPKKAAKPEKAVEVKEEKTEKEEPKAERKIIDPSSSPVLEVAVNYVTTIVLGMGAEKCEITAFEASDDEVVLELNVGEDYGIFIGKWGDTLDSIQYLTRLATNRVKKDGESYPRISVNIGNYRQKRNTYLKELATKKAGYVKRTGRSYTFDPMNPYERRIVHTTVQSIEGVISHSVGEEGSRRLIISLTEGTKPTGGRGRNDRNRNGRNRDRKPSQRVEAPEREKMTDEGAKRTALYGKIN